MSTQTFASDSIPAQGFQLGYLHKQAARTDGVDTQPTSASLSQVGSGALSNENLFGGVPKLKLGPSEPAETTDDADPWSTPSLTMGQEVKKIDPVKDDLSVDPMQLPLYEADVPEAPAARDNREAIRKILTSLAPGATIGGATGVGLSLAGDARKGEGVNLGKAVGMGVGGASLGALIQGLAQRNKMKAMMA
jgi:hypothetical protein